MQMKPVKSSNIAAIGYENGTLAVRFMGSKTTPEGSLYHYPGVTQAHYDKLMKSESLGVGFSSIIRNAYKGVQQVEKKK
jgi:hypothetical protein